MRETSPGANHIQQIDRVPIQKPYVFDPALGHALHADDHRVRNFLNRGEKNVRILRRGVGSEAPLAAAKLKLRA